MSDIINRFLKEDEEDVTTEKYLTFLIDSQTYAVEISNVKEIISIQEVTAMPDFPKFIKGIINVRGVIIPVIDMRYRFKKPEKEYDERSSIVITIINELLIGLIVDSVDEVLDVEIADISPSPKLSADSSAKYVSSIAKIGKKIVLILDTNRLLNSDELLGIADMID